MITRLRILAIWTAAGLFLAADADALATLVAVRTIDGTGNNLITDPTWGAADTPVIRHPLAPADYPGDGSGSTILDSPARENPRVISNAIVAQGPLPMFNDRNLSDYVWQWGQFLDHDIDLTVIDAAYGTADIPVPSGDILGPNPIPFSRSEYHSSTGTAGDPRQQMNRITSFIDASNVYGSDDGRAMQLRTLTDGKLDSRFVGGEELLPLDGTGNVFAGDIRASEQIGLTSMHTLFLREHNRLVDLLTVQKPGADDAELYETARKIVGAEIQIITYNEFFPALLGSSAPDPMAYSYSSTLDPSISNEFSTAAYRFGHSMLAQHLQLVDNSGNSVGSVALRDAFETPEFLEIAGNIDLLLKGLASQRAQEIDSKIVDDVRNFLFGPPGLGGLDLASLNMQRGRDHGLPDYNALRVAYGLSPVSNFSDITSDLGRQTALALMYGNLDNIDPWVGGLAEDHLAGSSLGALNTAILVDQFTRLRDGDRFFYIGDADLSHPDIQAVIDLESLTLADVIQANTELTLLQSNVFLVPEPSTLTIASALACLAFALVGCRRWRWST